ncbi:hypothetical protein INT46_009992, partial [Mucor plumbeus]
RPPLPRLFIISPSPSFRWKFVTISVNSLCCFTKDKLPRGYNAQLNLFYKYFDFKGLGFKSIDDLRPNGLNNVLFFNTIKSDGFAVDFLFERIRAAALKEEVERIYQSVFIDPDRKAVYTAVIGLDTSNHQIRQCSTKEYYNLTGPTKYSSRLQKLKYIKGLTSIETNIPIQKTYSSILYDRFIQYIIVHKDKLLALYGRQRAPEVIVNMLFNGDKKRNKKKINKTKRSKWRKMKKAAKKRNELLDRKARAKKKRNDNSISSTVKAHDITKYSRKRLVKLRGLRHGVTSMFYRTLKEREKESELLVVPIDEFRKSRICNICKTDTLYKASHTGGFGVLVCKTCKTLWQRDVNTFKNIMSIASSIWNQDGSPTAFKRV